MHQQKHKVFKISFRTIIIDRRVFLAYDQYLRTHILNINLKNFYFFTTRMINEPTVIICLSWKHTMPLFRDKNSIFSLPKSFNKCFKPSAHGATIFKTEINVYHRSWSIWRNDHCQGQLLITYINMSFLRNFTLMQVMDYRC